MGWTVALVECKGLVSVVQVYTAGLRFETEPMVCSHRSVTSAGSQAPLPAAHRLPLQCPLLKPSSEHRSAWTALWQAACLLRPEISPTLWRQRIRRLERITHGRSAVANHLDLDTGLGEVVERVENLAVAVWMSKWLQHLMPPRMLGLTDRFRGVSVSQDAVLDLKSVETCVRSGGVALLARHPQMASLSDPSMSNPEDTTPPIQWVWRVVAGLEGTKAREHSFQSRSVLLLPQDAEGVWGCGYGGRLDALATDSSDSKVSDNLWTWRSVDGGKGTVHVGCVLRVQPIGRV